MSVSIGPAEQALRSGVTPDRSTLVREVTWLRRSAQQAERDRDEMAGRLAHLMGLVRIVHGPALRPIGEMVKAEQRLQELVEGWGDAPVAPISG